MGNRKAAPAALLLLLLLLPGAVLAQQAPPAAPPAAPPSVSAHEVTVFLDPEKGLISATDRMTVRRGAGQLPLRLRGDLKIHAIKVDGRPDDSIARDEKEPGPGISRYLVRIPKGPGETGTVELTYEGVIREDVQKAKDLAHVAGDRSGGTISPEGVYLGEDTGWVPLDDSMATFSVSATVPAGWSVATQGGVPVQDATPGRDAAFDKFDFPAGIPCDRLWLQAGKWKVERRTAKGGVSVATYLSEGNAALSPLLLDAAEEYLAAFGKVLGPYPHAKFDIVENFFSTGYGMPSATLFGGDVVQQIGMASQRSGGKIPPGYLDHELMHGWWGNGVFVDYASGNWCEALTTYCSNYLRKEWESPAEGAKQRRAWRARFAARVRPDRDYPLRKFTGKTEDFEDDIGYEKGAMLFHMARRALGDEAFFGALRDLAKGFTGRRAAWADIRGLLEKRSGRNLRALFDAMLDRTGAPVLVLRGCTAAASGDGWTVSGRVSCAGEPWPVSVPIVVETATGTESTTVDVEAADTDFSLRTASVPLRVILDPDAHSWRGFAPGEAPAMLDATLHDQAGYDCLLSTPNSGIVYGPVAAALKERGAPVCTPRADGTGFDPAPAPAGTRSTLVLGHLAPGGVADGVLGLLRPRVRVEGTTLWVGDQKFEGEDVALLVSIRLPQDPRHFLTLYGGISDAALTAARRVFFYGGDGIVVFKAGRPVLRVEAEGEDSSRAPVLDGLLPQPSADRVKAMVAALCSAPLEGRLAGTEADGVAVDLVQAALSSDGLEVVSQPVSFEVADWDGTGCLGIGGKEADEKGIPFCFSADNSEWRAPVPLPVGASTTVESFLASLHDALEKGAAAVIVLGPTEPPAALADYLVHPSTLPASEKRKTPNAAMAVTGRRSRMMMPEFPVKVPVVYYGREPDRAWVPTHVRSAVTRKRIETVNLLAVIPGSDPALAGEAVLLSAHHDHLGPGYPGANDDASGVAAVREATRALLAAKGALRRPVVIAIFGAEEWGLLGSRAFVEHPPEGFPKVVAALSLDTVGGKGVGDVNVVGGSVYPALGALVSRCLAGAGLPTGRDIDNRAFAWGSDHYSFHRAGIPAVDLFSAEYRTMHTPADSPETVDPAKVARIARAAAAFALAVSRGGPPR
jgi:hypothetical protein